MAKLQRKSAKVFAENATAGIGGIAQFGSLAAGNEQFSKDVDVIQALNAYKEGWSSAVTGNKSPAIEDRNALDYLLSYQQAYIMQHGIPEWLSTETYYEGCFASVGQALYVSKTDNNTGNDPTTDSSETNWVKFPTPAEVQALFALQANTNLSNVTSTGKTNSCSWISPDWDSAVSISTSQMPYTFTQYGWYLVECIGTANAGGDIRLNGFLIAYNQSYNIQWSDGSNNFVRVKPGDVLSYSGSPSLNVSVFAPDEH